MVAGCSAVAVCTGLAILLPATYPTVAHVGLAGVAMAAAGALDDASAAVTDSTPRHLWWRTAMRLPLTLVPVAAWLLSGAALEVHDRTWPFTFWAAVGTAVAVACVGAAAVARRTGVPEPGEAVGTVVGAVLLAELMIGWPSVRGISPLVPEPEALLWWVPVLLLGVGGLAWGARDRFT
jgi:hypothetical protein